MFKLLVSENQKPLVVIVGKETSKGTFDCRVANTDEQIVASEQNLKPLDVNEYTFKKASFHFKKVTNSICKESYSETEIETINTLLSRYNSVLTHDELTCLLNVELQRDVTPYLKDWYHTNS